MDKVRERAIALSRELVRTCADAIRELRKRAGRESILRADALAATIEKATAATPSSTLRAGRERPPGAAETHILEALVSAKGSGAETFHCTRRRSFSDGDAIGELRRVSQDA